jgi:hypothetical protein
MRSAIGSELSFGPRTSEYVVTVYTRPGGASEKYVRHSPTFCPNA